MIPIEEPVRILLLAANPADTQTLRLGQEASRIRAALEKRTKRPFDLQHREAVRAKDLRFEVLSHKPHFVHFSGHGEGEEGIVLEDDNGATHLVTTEALESFFEIFKERIQCVFLNCCYSQPQAEAIARHIPFVIGTRETITDKAAIEFSVAFYEAVGQKEDVARAFQYGIAALKLANLFSEARIPILFPEVLTTKVGSTKPRPILTTQEEKTLRGWILEDHCRLVLLQCSENAATHVNGRTASDGEALRSSPLAGQIAMELRLRNSFECTASASLDSAPPLSKTLSQLLTTFSTGTKNLGLIENSEEQTYNLIHHFRKRRCLVLLEGLDALFDSGTSRYLSGCSEYEKFFEQILRIRHQSCILATVRRDIPDIARQGPANQVRFMDLRKAKERSEDAEEEERDGGPEHIFDLRRRYSNRSSLYNHVKKCSQSTLFRTSARLPRDPLAEAAREARLSPVSRPESAPVLYSFLEGPRPLLAIIGESGSGKTVLSHQIATELPLVLYYDTHHIEATGSLTATLARDLGADEQEIEFLFQHFAWLLNPTEYFVILIDAINESIRIDPLVLKAEIEAISSLFPKSFKLIYTCRKVYWEGHIQAQSPLPGEIYHDASVFVLGDFSDSEAREAFQRYQAFFHFSGSYDNLNEELRRKVANPLMLRMLAEGYQGAELPSFAPAVQVFHRYYHTLQERPSLLARSDPLVLC